MLTTSLLGVLAIVFTVLVVGSWLRAAFAEGLRDVPGPTSARISGLLRLNIARSGDAPKRHRKLHEKYGTVVRLAPNHVSISDPSMIPIIYGINSKFRKVRKENPELGESIHR